MLRDGEGPGEPLGHPLLLVCTHGIRDRCCARYGQELCRNLHGLAPDGWVWQASHVGGDRFAGNLVVLPEGSSSAASGGATRRASSAATSRAGSTSTATAAGRPIRSRCRRPRPPCASERA